MITLYMRTRRINSHQITHVKPMKPELSRYNFKNKTLACT